MQAPGAHDKGTPYRNFAIELVIDFVIMFFVMYTMIATIGHLYLNVNNVYMTLMMVAPMAVVMLISMRSMFTSLKSTQFLRSMIPHHSGAILMCEQSSSADPEIVALCREIVAAQKAEIAKMRAILARQ